MPTEESLPMYLILLKKRRQHILFLLIFVCLLVFWVNFHLSRHLNERVPNCNIPCIGTTCINCLTEEREEKIPRIDILEKLKLKQAFRVRKLPPRGDTDASDQICKRPNFDAKHDSIKYAFHSMERLNCTGESLFKVENAVFKLDRNVLKGRELERCDYYGIVRITDDYSSYSEPLTKNAEPFDLLIKEDFVRIKCFLKKAEDDNEIKSGRKNRKLLQLSLDHFQKDVNPIALRLAKTLWSFDQSMSNRVNTSKDLQNLREIQQLIKAAYYKSNKVSFNEAKVPVKRQNYKLLLDELQTKIQNGKGAEIDTKGKYLQLKSNRRLKGVDEMVNDENYQLLVDEIGTLIQNSKRADYDIESKHSQWKSSRRLQEEDEMVNDENYQLLVDEIRALIEKSKRADYEIESKHTQLKPNRRLQEVDKVVNNEGDPEDDNKELIINDKEIEGYIEAPGNESDPIFDYAMYADQLEEEPADFDQFIVQVYPKEGVHRRILKQMRELNAERKHLRELSMNVLIFGLDSMSHMSYQRKLPKTYLFLRDKLRAVILHGYNIVGDATTAALLPMLTGKAKLTLKAPMATKVVCFSHLLKC